MDLGDWTFWARYTEAENSIFILRDVGSSVLGYGDGIFWDYDDWTWVHTPKPNPIFTVSQLSGYIGHTQSLAENLSLDYGFSYSTFSFSQFRQNAFPTTGKMNTTAGSCFAGRPAARTFAFGGEISHHELGLKARLAGSQSLQPAAQ